MVRTCKHAGRGEGGGVRSSNHKLPHFASLLSHMVRHGKICAHMIESLDNMFASLADGVTAEMSTNDPTKRAKEKADSDTAFHNAIKNQAFTAKGYK